MPILPFQRKKKVASDQELLSNYKQTGDLDLLGDLYGRYMDLVYGLCLKHFKSREDAQDAVIQIFEKLVVEVPKHTIDNFKSWLYVVAKNYCLMELRQRNTDRQKAVAYENEFAVFMEKARDLHPIDEDPAQRNDEALRHCIERLKQQQKECVELFYFSGKSYREICAILQLEEKQVKSHIQNGKRKLKICLESQS